MMLTADPQIWSFELLTLRILIVVHISWAKVGSYKSFILKIITQNLNYKWKKVSTKETMSPDYLCMRSVLKLWKCEVSDSFYANVWLPIMGEIR